jgi:hydrogenase expression/formation protein HypE
MAEDVLPMGKLPVELLRQFLKGLPATHPDVIVGPGIGMDAAVIRFGDEQLVFKTDPITFATDDIAWYLVTINANDIACMGGIPKYLLVTFLLPQGATTPESATTIFTRLKEACAAGGITLVGGHTEITYGIDRPIAVGFMIGTISRHGIIRSSGAKPGDAILLSKGIPLEATALLAREFAHKLGLDEDTLKQAQDLIYSPGISVVRDARIALETGGVTAMHDPTEGGLATGLSELAGASGCGLEVRRESIPAIDLADRILSVFSIDPLGALASGSLIVCCKPENAVAILSAWEGAGIIGALIGTMTSSPELILYRDGKPEALPEFKADEITKAFKPGFCS